MAKPNVKPFGAVGTEITSGFISGEEFNQLLTGDNAVRIYDEMHRTDSQVKASIRIVTLPITGADWEVVPASEDPRDLEIAEFVRQDLFNNTTFSFDQWITDVVRYLIFGFAVFEKIWKTGDDGKWHIKDVQYRKPKTIERWFQNDDGTLKAIEQHAYVPSYETLTMPNETILVFTNEKEGWNWEGISLLRSIYINWKSKNMLLRLDPIRHERFAVPPVKIKLPDSAETNEQGLVKQSWIDAAVDIGEYFRSHEKGYLIEPPGWDISIVDVKASSMTNIMESMTYHDQQIMTNVLADFMMLGKTKSGNRALGDTLKDTFMLALKSVVQYIEHIINESPERRRFVKDMVDFNFPGVKEYPKVKAKKLGDVDFELVIKTFKEAVAANAIKPRPGDERFFRALLNMPELQEGEEDEPKEENNDDSEEIRNDCGCGHAHKIQLAENGRWRPFTELEEQTGIEDTDRRVKEREAAVVATVAAWRNRWTKELTQKGTNLLNKKMNINDFKKALQRTQVTGKGAMANELEKELKKTFDDAADKVNEELKAQGIKPKPVNNKSTPGVGEPVAENKKEARQSLRGAAEIMVSALSTKLFNEFRKTATQQKLQGQVSSQGLTDSMNKLSKTVFDREAQEQVRQAFGLGRNAEAMRNKDQIKMIVHTEILDENICANCPGVDGMTFQPGDPEEALFVNGQYIECEGQERCRGQNIYVV